MESRKKALLFSKRKTIEIFQSLYAAKLHFGVPKRQHVGPVRLRAFSSHKYNIKTDDLFDNVIWVICVFFFSFWLVWITSMCNKGSKNTPVCGPAKLSCWIVASSEFSIVKNITYVNRNDWCHFSNWFQETSSDSCNCLPGCNELQFKISTMSVKLSSSVQMGKIYNP